MEQQTTPVGSATASSAAVESQESRDVIIDKLKKEKENFKKKAEELEAQFKKVNEEKLIETQNYKTLAEQRSEEVKNWQSKYEQLDKVQKDAIKIGALKKELGKLGMDMKFMDLAVKAIDINTLTVDSDTNAVLGVESAAKLLRESAAPLFVSQTPSVTHAAPQGTQQPLTLDDWKALPSDEKIKREKELFQTLGINLKP